MTRVTIKQLQEELSSARVQIRDHRDSVDELRDDLNKILGNTNSYSLNGRDKDWDEIKEAVRRMKTNLRIDGEVISVHSTLLKEENARLWYMLRAAMGDEHRSEPRDRINMESRIPKPNWDS